jgi:hypothetical protein
MSEETSFVARKYSVGKEPFVLSGNQKDLDSGALTVLNPIAADDWVELDLGDSLDRFKSAQWLEFDDAEEIVFDEDAAKWWPENTSYSDENLESQMGAVPRFAFLSQGGQTWQVVQLPVGSAKVRFLRSIQDAYVATERYDSLRVLGDYSYHSDGPGPVSWDGGMALLDVGDYLVQTSDGDSISDDMAFAKGKDVTSAVLGWLDRCFGHYIYTLKASEIKWTDTDKAEELRTALSYLDEFARVGLDVIEAENRKILAALKKGNRAVRQLVSWLSDPEGAYADKLIAGVRDAIENESGGVLLYGDGIIEYFERQVT